MILLGFRHTAPSTPSIILVGVAVGVGIIPASPVFSTSRNPNISNTSIRRSLTGSSLVEVPGFTGSVYSPLIPYAFLLLSYFH